MNAYLAEFREGHTAAPHVHDAAEFLFVTAGTLTVDVEGTAHVLGAGDSIYIRPSIPHTYTSTGARPCRRRRHHRGFRGHARHLRLSPRIFVRARHLTGV
jgi:glyoxylate utilization-related uncharacterized protein